MNAQINMSVPAWLEMRSLCTSGRRRSRHEICVSGFTIIELLVVVSIIALLLGILLPAIGKARDQAHVTRSQSNLRQLGAAHATYAAEWNDNQWTNIPHNLMAYSPGDFHGAFAEYGKAYPKSGQVVGGRWVTELGWARSPATGAEGMWTITGNTPAIPIDLVGIGMFAGGGNTETKGYGSFRLINLRSFNRYVGGRYFDATFYAPKDRALITAIASCFDAPGEYCRQETDDIAPLNPSYQFGSSYVLSPAAMFTPDLFSAPSFTGGDMWQMHGLFRSPTFSQARHPDLKTHMIEHHWLQRPHSDCHPSVVNPAFDQCQPYYFNGGIESVPVTLFYDGHVAMLGLREAIDANTQAVAQSGPNGSLWHTGTPMGTNGYFHDLAHTPPGSASDFSNETSSYHILTRHGILGRDTFSQ